MFVLEEVLVSVLCGLFSGLCFAWCTTCLLREWHGEILGVERAFTEACENAHKHPKQVAVYSVLFGVAIALAVYLTFISIAK